MQQQPKPVPPAEYQEQAIASMDAAALVRILQDKSAPEFQKAKACVRLGELGAKEAIAPMAALLGDEHLNVYARYGLEPIADPAAAEALRAAVAKLKGNVQIGVVNSLGKKRDELAVPMLGKLVYGQNVPLAQAAAAALGSIGGLASAKELQAALGKTTGMMKMVVADAALVCCERLIADGKREPALALYAVLSAPTTPKPQRLAAMSGIIAEERSLARPR
ncbi:MAG: hypothetical protein JNK87_24255 [Bryobacterales bacterium]|nr:hypothetical protein [Bryobacterales bacterium]